MIFDEKINLLRNCFLLSGGIVRRVAISVMVLLVLVFSGCFGDNVSIANWPFGYSSAVVVSFEVEQAQAADLERVVELLREHDAGATFFVVAGYYEGAPGILEPLKGFDVASKGWNQSEWVSRDDSHRGELMRSVGWLNGAGFDTAGFKAPFLRINDETFSVLPELGFDYDSSLVGHLPSMRDGIVEVPLAVSYDPFWNEDVERYLPLFYYVFEETYAVDGLFLFHTYPEHVGEGFESFLFYVSGRDVWMVSAREVADWWALRSDVSLMVEDGAAVLTNNGDRGVSSLALKIDGDYREVPFIASGESVRVEL